MSFYKDHYDVIIIGGALAGMSAALQLQSKGVKDILILEKHNLPGGLATDFVRNGIEIEATLHEMMSIGTKEEPLKVGQFFMDMGVDIDWLKVPECYRVVLPNSGIDATIHDGYERAAREVDAVVPGTFEKVHELFLLCRRVYDSMNILSVTPMSKVQMLLKHPDFVKTVGYSATEVIKTFDLPKKAIEMITPYWIYVGNRMDDLPFTIYAFLMADYLTGSYVCRGYSHEMSMKMEKKVEENGAQFEFKQEVEKILVKDGKVYGVRTRKGDEIHCDYVISAPYPNKVYTQMIEPLSEVPEGAIKLVNGRELSLCPVSVIAVLEGTPEENGLKNYSTFSGTTMDTNEIWENYKNITEPYNFITTICLNYANPDCVPEGYTQISITALVPVTAFEGVKEEDYFDLKRRLANEMMEEYIKISGIDFRPNITEIEVTTPMTIAHYVGAWKGSIYGYLHSLKDHAVARLQMKENDHFIEGLEFAGAHGMSGDGMGPQITNGRAAAKGVLDDMAKKEAAK
ncbi:MAG: NAD(P)/FAD-dependent oxidoreductase [Erysipelotrichaceae bacterium]|nr:NAD(P)/FAD-dependent oxidoreductase [Erysipelotrichaceae bacterium]